HAGPAWTAIPAVLVNSRVWDRDHLAWTYSAAKPQCEPRSRLCEKEPASRFRNRTPQFPGRFYPFPDYYLNIGHCFLVRRPISTTPRQFWHFSDKRFVFIAPINDNLIPIHPLHLLNSSTQMGKRYSCAFANREACHCQKDRLGSMVVIDKDHTPWR